MAAGTGFRIVNETVPEVPPPGAGFDTDTEATPVTAKSLPGTVALRLVPLKKVVVKPAPFHSTVEVATKLAPVTVRVKPAPPTRAAVGEIDVAVGAGLLILKGSVLEMLPPGMITPMFAIPAVVRSPAGMVAVNSVELTNVVARSAPFH